jgi:hypothetical protein
MTGSSGASSTPRLVDSIRTALECRIIRFRFSRMMTLLWACLVIIPTPAKSIIATERNIA